jgi:hypothetical protein
MNCSEKERREWKYTKKRGRGESEINFSHSSGPEFDLDKALSECSKEKIQSIPLPFPLFPTSPHSLNFFSFLSSLLSLSSSSFIYSYSVPGFIQPDGVLFCVEKKTLRVLQCSANVETMLGIPLSSVIKTSTKWNNNII